MVNQSKEHCPSCGHVVSKSQIYLSPIEFRRIVNNMKTIDDVIELFDYLVRFIKGKYKLRDFVDKFSEDLQQFINSHSSDYGEIDYIRIWLLGFVNTKDYSDPLKPPLDEVQLYQFLQAEYQDGINETFTDIYDRYCDYVDTPLSKNKASRALSAFGLKTAMKKIVREGKRTCCIKLEATTAELSDLLQKNGQ